MKALTCEMCGSTNLLKQDGVFVCQSCGTKYSVEEAKKMMVEGTVDVKGTVKVDTSDELNNLYEIARRARDTDNAENAAKYYEMILVKDSNSWEAQFYSVYFQTLSCKVNEIGSAGQNLTGGIALTFQIVKDRVTNIKEQEIVIREICTKSLIAAEMLASAATNVFK